MNIGGIQLKSDILLAPVAGFSEVGFRRLCAMYGAGLTYTELVSAKGLCYNNRGTQELLATTQEESPVAVQLFGSEPEFIYRAAKDERLAKFDIIDINAGCPVKKLFNNGDGSALMKNPQLIEEIVQAAREGSGKPVTIKMRAGIEMGKPLAVECALAAQKGGAAAVAVHARYREQYYGGLADHTITRAVKDAVDIPVIANGDITDAESLKRVAQISGADGFMIARGALGRPYIFAALRGKEYEFDRKSAVYQHIETLRQFMPDRVVANVMKLQLCWYAKGENYAKAVRVAISNVKNIDDIFAIAEEYFV